MSFKFTAQVVKNLPVQFDELKHKLKQICESKVNKSIRFCAFDVNYQPLPLIYWTLFETNIFSRWKDKYLKIMKIWPLYQILLAVVKVS